MYILCEFGIPIKLAGQTNMYLYETCCEVLPDSFPIQNALMLFSST